jgi:hypothetical protein
VVVDITGKGNRVRSVAVPAWVKVAIDAWTTATGIGSVRPGVATACGEFQ